MGMWVHSAKSSEAEPIYIEVHIVHHFGDTNVYVWQISFHVQL